MKWRAEANRKWNLLWTENCTLKKASMSARQQNMFKCWMVFFFCFYFWIRLCGNWTYCKCLQKKGVPLKDCLISEKNNKLTFYDSFQKTRRIGNSISKSSLFMCKTYEFFFCHTKINEPMNWRKRKIGVNRIKSNLSSFYRWTQVSNHWFGKCRSIDKNGCKRTHKANDSANKIRTFRKRERDFRKWNETKGNQAAFVQDSFFWETFHHFEFQKYCHQEEN